MIVEQVEQVEQVESDFADKVIKAPLWYIAQSTFNWCLVSFCVLVFRWVDLLDRTPCFILVVFLAWDLFSIAHLVREWHVYFVSSGISCLFFWIISVMAL